MRGARGGRFLRGRGTRGLMQGRGAGRGAVRGRAFIQNQGRGEMKTFRLVRENPVICFISNNAGGIDMQGYDISNLMAIWKI